MEISIEKLSSPLFIAWQINRECNLGCLHCCEEAGEHLPDSLSMDEISNFLKQIVDLKIPYVAISGGEPLIHPYFWEISEYLRKNGINIKVETNGEFIDEQIAKKFSELRFRSIQISLDGSTPEIHEKLRINGNWRKVIEACKLLKKYNVNTEIVFVPTKFNIHQIGEVIDLAYSINIYAVYTGKIMRIGRAAKNWNILCPTEKQYQEFFEILEEKAKIYDGKMKIFYYPYDVIEELKYRLSFPAASLLVLPNGKVKLIGPLPFICGDIRKNSLREIWRNYKRGWKEKKVIEFAKKVISNPELLSESNKWQELYS